MKPGTSRTAQNAACNGRLHRGRGMKEQNKAIDEKALTELRKLVVEREKLDGRIKELLGMNTETRPTQKPLSREQFRMLCGV